MNLTPCEIQALTTAVANAVACQLSTKELAYWGIIISQIGSALSSIAALQELCDGDGDSAGPALLESV